jgi:tetratricopeptide (TPR) repeat protein
MGPFDWQEKDIEIGDFDLLGAEFVPIVQRLLQCDAVYFAGPATDALIQPAWKAGIEMVRHEQKGVWGSSEKDVLFLPIWAKNDLAGVAVATGCSNVVQDFTAAQLHGASKQISREMRLLKQSCIDPVTGLFNGRALIGRLGRLQQSIAAGESMFFSLLLVELHPRASDARLALESAKKTAAFLTSLVGHMAVPCHLGNSIFGLIWEGVVEKEALKTADLLLRWLKRENFPRGHIGITASDIEPPENGGGEIFFEQSWKALEIARKRSPFSLCSYRYVSDSYAHPLKPVDPKTMSKLRVLWGKKDSFGMVQLHKDQGGAAGGFDVALKGCMGREPYFAIEGGDRLIFLDGRDEKETLQRCEEIRHELASAGCSVSMGVALYPCKDSKKHDVPGNCQRALLHTVFYGPGSMTVFDAVSLNISGDVYYNEGDLASAVKEYRRGRAFDPDNTNLMNSLGVTYANMNKYAEAVAQFEEVLSRDKKNFMALYNLGFSCLALDDRKKGLYTLEKASLTGEKNFDLFFQLGKLYCRDGRYKDAVNVLQQGEKLGPKKVSDISHGAVYRYLGEAYRGAGDNEKAIVSLQRASRYNPGDSAALSILGELYSDEKEGDEIALSLCRQAVELESDQADNWLRLGNVLMQQGDPQAAVSVFQKGLECDRQSAALFCSLGRANQKLGNSGTAVKMYKGALRIEPDSKEASLALKRIMSEKT